MIPTLIALSVALTGTPPRTVTTQGLLRNSAGLVVDGTYAVTFRLYAESTGGSPFWQETRSLNVTDGAFAAELGTVQPLPEGAFAAELPWVEFVVGNEPPLPRRPLTSAPHAIQADVANDVTCVGCVTATETSFMPAACTSGQVLKWGAAGWTCGSDVDSTYSGANFALSAKGCAAGSVMTGISTAGEPICANLNLLMKDYINANCRIYFGWSDSCTTCTTQQKSGWVEAAECKSVAGANGSCSDANIDGTVVKLFGLNTTGDVDGNDKFYVGFRCL